MKLSSHINTKTHCESLGKYPQNMPLFDFQRSNLKT